MSTLQPTYMYLGIRCDFDPAKVTSQISMAPWKCMAKHSKSLEHRIPRSSLIDYGLVEVVSECPDLEEMSRALYQQLAPYRNDFIELSKKLDVKITCNTCLWMVHDLNVSTPPIGFSADMVKFLGEIGASIDVDMYRDDEYRLPPTSPFYNGISE